MAIHETSFVKEQFITNSSNISSFSPLVHFHVKTGNDFIDFIVESSTALGGIERV
jgi:hypothetical protein